MLCYSRVNWKIFFGYEQTLFFSMITWVLGLLKSWNNGVLVTILPYWQYYLDYDSQFEDRDIFNPLNLNIRRDIIFSISHWIPHTVTACNRYIDIFYQVSIINKVSSLESGPNTTPGKKENNQSFFTSLCGVCSFSPVQCTAVKNKLNYSSILHLNNI